MSLASIMSPGEDPGVKDRGAPNADVLQNPPPPANSKPMDPRVKAALIGFGASVIGVGRVVLEWALRRHS